MLTKLSPRIKKELSNPKNILKIIAIIFVFFLIYSILNRIGIYVQQEHVRVLIFEAGNLGLLVYGIYYLFSVIIAPFPIIAVLTLVVNVYGAEKIVIYSYILSLIGATVNFYIARFLGRPLLKKLIGTRGLGKVDKYTDNFGIESLIILRLLGALMYEYISFAAGLSNMSFRIFITITSLASIPYHIILFLVVSSIDKPGSAFIAFSTFIYGGFVISIVYFIVKSHIVEKIINKPK